MNIEQLKELPAQARELVLGGLADAISHVFGWAVLFAALVPVLAWFIREIPLRTTNDPTPDRAPTRIHPGTVKGRAPLSQQLGVAEGSYLRAGGGGPGRRGRSARRRRRSRVRSRSRGRTARTPASDRASATVSGARSGVARARWASDGRLGTRSVPGRPGRHRQPVGDQPGHVGAYGRVHPGGGDQREQGRLGDLLRLPRPAPPAPADGSSPPRARRCGGAAGRGRPTPARTGPRAPGPGRTSTRPSAVCGVSGGWASRPSRSARSRVASATAVSYAAGGCGQAGWASWRSRRAASAEGGDAVAAYRPGPARVEAGGSGRVSRPGRAVLARAGSAAPARGDRGSTRPGRRARASRPGGPG